MLLPYRKGAGGVVELHTERDGEREEEKRVNGRKSGAAGRRSGKILGSRHEERPCGENSYRWG